MDVLATLTEDMKVAMRARDSVALETVRYLLSAVKNAQIDKPGHDPLTELEFTVIVKKIIKNTQEAIEQYAAGNRQDLVEAEQPKLTLMQKYLPQQLSEDELRAIVSETVAQNPGLGMGPLTGIIMKQTAGKTDGGAISKILREVL